MFETGGFVFLFILFIFGIWYITSQLVKSVKVSLKRYRIRRTEKQIQKAIGDPQIAQLMMWLREDFGYNPDYRVKEKLRILSDNPEKAYIALRTALFSKDIKLQRVGIIGLEYIKHPKATIDLMEFMKAPSIHEQEALDALTNLSRFVPIEGPGGYISIINFVCKGKFPNLYIGDKAIFINRLLRIAVYDRNSDLTKEQYQAIFSWTNKYCSELIDSKNTTTRHLGEDLRSDLQNRIKAVNSTQFQKLSDLAKINKKAGEISKSKTIYTSSNLPRTSRLEYPMFDYNNSEDEILPSGYRRSDYHAYGLTDFDIELWGLDQPGAPNPLSSGWVMVDMLDGDFDGNIDF